MVPDASIGCVEDVYGPLWSQSRTCGVVVGPDGIVTSATQSCRSVFGMDVVHTPWVDRYNPVTREILTAHGTMQSVSAHEHDNPDGSTVVWLSDASLERLYESALAKANQAQDELRQFEFAVSHDLMEPLRGISTAVSALDKLHADELSTDAKELVDHALLSARAMHKLLQDFLSYVRLDTQSRKMDKDVDLNVVVSDVLDSHRTLVRESGCSIVVGDLPTVKGDWRMIYQVFSNLISNAVKYKDPHRQCVVNISADRSESGWVVTVRDNGLGIPESKVDTVFAPFVRVHKQIHGSGIGLAIVKRCVEQHGGTITAQSTVGVGTSFSFSLPTGE